MVSPCFSCTSSTAASVFQFCIVPLTPCFACSRKGSPYLPPVLGIHAKAMREETSRHNPENRQYIEMFPPKALMSAETTIGPENVPITERVTIMPGPVPRKSGGKDSDMAT